MPQRQKVVVLDETIDPAGVDLLRDQFQVEWLDWDTPQSELLEAVSSAAGIVVRRGRIDRAIFESAPQLRIIARHGSGVDSIDLPAARERDVIVTTTGPANVRAVAEFTVGLIFAGLRHIPRASEQVHHDGWDPKALIGTELRGKTLGVIGFGQIGQEVVCIANAIGMDVVVADPFVDEAAVHAANAKLLSYQELLGVSHVFTYHVRLSDETIGLFDNTAITYVRTGAWLVNTSRGEVCTETALVQALDTAVLAGAALDTFEHEPLAPNSPLRGRDNVVLSPHIAGQTVDAMRAMSLTAAEEIVLCLTGNQPRYVYLS